MKYRAKVIDVYDPDDLGRIRVSLYGFADGAKDTPWCWPCVPLAGNGYGFYCLPDEGNEVWVEQDSNGDWVWVGGFWSGRNHIPRKGASDNRLIRTLGGHQIELKELGSIKVTHSTGGCIEIKYDGNIIVTATSNVTVNVPDGKKVMLAGTTGQPIPLGTKLMEYLEYIIDLFNNHQHEYQSPQHVANPKAKSGVPTLYVEKRDFLSRRSTTE